MTDFLSPMLLCDFYKISHRNMYPQKTEFIYSTWTPRVSRIEGIDSVVAFGFQQFAKKFLIKFFNDNFFNQPIEKIIHEYTRIIKFTLGVENPEVDHIKDLHSLGYLPIKITAVDEGISVPIRTPMLTIENTDPRFFWLTNYIESLASCELWQASTSATIAREFKRILTESAIETSDAVDFVDFQGHDFSFRGMSSLDSSITSGMGHLLSFCGTDTIPAIQGIEYYYGGNIEKEMIGCSVPASEHSIQCTYEDDFLYIEKMISDVHPTGIVSVVSDGYDFWDVMTNILPKLKDIIMSRDGKTVIRPDSGNVVDIICGTEEIVDLDGFEYVESIDDCKDYMEDIIRDKVLDETPHGEHGVESESKLFRFKNVIYNASVTFDWNRYDKQYYYIDGNKITVEKAKMTPEEKGAIQILYETFGGTVNSKGYIDLDPHIGLIYGDSITLDICKKICERLKKKGFSSTNLVFGIGSYTYQYNTRDTFGFALKSTSCIIDGVEKAIFKDPKTDSGVKKSQKGRVHVSKSNGEIKFQDGLDRKTFVKTPNILKTVFKDGKLVKEITFKEIKENIKM